MRKITKKARSVFATNLKSLRLKKGISQEKLASLCGLHRTYLGGVEREERNISIDNMAKIARALDVDLSDLLKI